MDGESKKHINGENELFNKKCIGKKREENDEQLTTFRLTFEGKFQYFEFIILIFSG